MKKREIKGEKTNSEREREMRLFRGQFIIYNFFQ